MDAIISDNTRYQAARKITILGALLNAGLGMLKMLTGFWFHSQALMADGVHSLSDLLTDLMVIIASRFGSQDPDETHPYGHQRFETAGTLLLALLLVVTGCAIAFNAVYEALYISGHPAPEKPALAIAILSLLVNEWLFHATRRVGEKIKSALIVANAWHHRSDAASSAVVVVGLAGSLLGYLWFDAIAAMIVGLLIIKMGIDYGWRSVRELVDTAVTPELTKQIEICIRGVDGVVKLHQLRTRQMGSDIYIDVHIQVDAWISVSEGHHIAQDVHYILVHTFEHIQDVTVHIDPEDDEDYNPANHLPSRRALHKVFLDSVYADYPGITKIVLHYLKGSIDANILLAHDATETADVLIERFHQQANIRHVHVLRHLAAATQSATVHSESLKK